MTQTSATQQRGEQAADTSIRPFRVNVPDADLADLRRRVAATRWPERETVADDSQGVPLALMQELARHWATDYDWRKCEAKLNALPQFITNIDGLDIHFIHVRSQHENALPLIVTHGWPGSVVEQLKIIEPLTNPTARGGSASDAFDVVIPYEKLKHFYTTGVSYALEMGTRPQTLYGIADSPIGLAAWLIDHGDGDGQPAAAISAALRRPTQGQPQDELTRDDVLDNITFYWLTNTGVSSSRLYWENKLSFFDVKNVSIPAAVSVFPGEFYQAPRSWAERAYPKLIHYNRVEKGATSPRGSSRKSSPRSCARRSDRCTNSLRSRA